MCSIGGEDEETLTEMVPEKESEEIKACVKCGEPGCVVTRVSDSFCKDCFQVYIVHKFRAAIGKSKLIRDGEQVLVAFSGGQHSSALLHLIQDGLSKRAHKKLRFTPILLHVDESGVPGLSRDEKLPTVEKVSELMTITGYPSYTTALEVALTLDNKDSTKPDSDAEEKKQSSPVFWDPSQHSELCGSERVEALRERLKCLVNGLASVSSKEDFIHNLRLQLIAHIACQLGLNKVLTAESSTRLAVRILTDILQGRGSQVALNTGFSDPRRGDVLFLRPVRDLSSKELVMYNYLFQVDTAVPISQSTKSDSLVSVGKLAETFVMGLQAGYHSTVSNIVRTSEKLGLPELTKGPKCWFCQSPLDILSGETSALRAVEVSLQLSKGQSSHGQGDSSATKTSCGGNAAGSGECCGEGDGSCQTRAQPRLSQEDINSGLCYGCRLSLRGYTGEVDNLPSFITHTAVGEKQREKLREQIADFLLEDDEEDLNS